jgi:hypothetical protein
MKKVLLCAAILAAYGCSEESSLMHFGADDSSEKNYITVNGKTIPWTYPVQDTKLEVLRENSSDSFTWINNDELLVAENINGLNKTQESRGTLKSYRVDAKTSRVIIPTPIKSICLGDEKNILLKNGINPSNKEKYPQLSLFLDHNQDILPGYSFSQSKYKIDPKIKIKSSINIKDFEEQLIKDPVKVNTSTNGCTSEYYFADNTEINNSGGEHVSSILMGHPYFKLDVYHDNSPREENSVKDFPRTKLYYHHINKDNIVEEKLYEMNIGLLEHIDTDDYTNYNKMTGEVRGNSVTVAFQATDIIYAIELNKVRNGLMPYKVEKLDISKEREGILKNLAYKTINKVKSGYIVTGDTNEGISIMALIKNSGDIKYLLKGSYISEEIKGSDNMCNIAFGHRFTTKNKTTLKIINTCEVEKEKDKEIDYNYE